MITISKYKKLSKFNDSFFTLLLIPDYKLVSV